MTEVFAIVVQLYDPDNKDNPYDGEGFVAGPYATAKLAAKAAVALRHPNPDQDHIRFSYLVLPFTLPKNPQSCLNEIYDELLGEEESEPRKPRVQVDQKFYLEYIDEYGPQTIQDLANIFDVHVSTARRNLDGLMFQGKLEREWRSPWASTIYWIPGKSPKDPPTGTTEAVTSALDGMHDAARARGQRDRREFTYYEEHIGTRSSGSRRRGVNK